MAADTSERVREVAEAREVSESEVFEQAFERGLDVLWKDVVLSKHLDGELTREAAIERVGPTNVERAERERDLAEQDVDWGLNA